MSFRHVWIVDLDGTLYHPMPVKLAMAIELLLVAPHKVRVIAKFRKMHERLRVTERDSSDPTQSQSPWELQLRMTATDQGVDVESMRALAEEWMVRRPGKWIRLFRRRGLLREVELFRASGGRCALVSDYPARQKLRALRAEDLFHAVISNGEPGGPGRLKPHPEGFLLAASALGAQPTDCLVIGDRLDADGAAAEAAGMVFRHIT